MRLLTVRLFTALILAAPLLASTTAASQSWSLLYTLEHPQPGPFGEFGLALASVGDINDDGTDDLAVYTIQPDLPPSATPVYLYSGATGDPLGALIPRAPGPDEGSFGPVLSALGDINGDGVPDILIGSPGDYLGDFQYGRVYLHSGATGDTLRVHETTSYGIGGLGYAAAGLGDVDGDAVPDYAASGGNAAGGVVFVFSGASGDTLRTLRSPSLDPNGGFGSAIVTIGDTDGDGVPDLLVAAPFEDSNVAREGRAYLFSGATGALLHTTPNPTATWDGLTLVAPGDITGDGIPDAIIGAPQGGDGSGEEGYPLLIGRVHVVSGATGGIVRTLASPYEGPSRRQGYTFGQAVAVVGDEDGDGVPEFAVGEPYAGGNGQVRGQGRVHVFSGAGGASPLTTLVNPAESDPSWDGEAFGRSLAALRMADGSVRLAVASSDYAAAQVSDGRVYVYSRFPVASAPSAPVAGLSVSVSPNPARSSASLALRLAEAALSVRVVVVDVLGRVVRRLDAGALAPGAHRLALDVEDLPPGVYVVRLTTGDDAATSMLTVAR